METRTHPHVLRIFELTPSGIVVVEGSDAARCTKLMKDIAHYRLPIEDTRLHPKRYYRREHGGAICVKVRIFTHFIIASSGIFSLPLSPMNLIHLEKTYPGPSLYGVESKD